MKMALTFGEKLRYLREEQELNQTELGKKLGITQRKLSYLECGKCEPNVDDIRAVCNFFKISADYMLDIPQNLKYPKK
ncbi:MAG: helix-turn-helix transcriptional regulator [Ruminococcaceae bacterium]|nr:helix-turn-helix transcriptional regulator [Oscillospiraceae bacterium]